MKLKSREYIECVSKSKPFAKLVSNLQAVHVVYYNYTCPTNILSCYLSLCLLCPAETEVMVSPYCLPWQHVKLPDVSDYSLAIDEGDKKPKEQKKKNKS